MRKCIGSNIVEMFSRTFPQCYLEDERIEYIKTDNKSGEMAYEAFLINRYVLSIILNLNLRGN